LRQLAHNFKSTLKLESQYLTYLSLVLFNATVKTTAIVTTTTATIAPVMIVVWRSLAGKGSARNNFRHSEYLNRIVIVECNTVRYVLVHKTSSNTENSGSCAPKGDFYCSSGSYRKMRSRC